MTESEYSFSSFDLPMNRQQLGKLKGHTDRLVDLALGTWERAKLLEPMMSNHDLNDRIRRERKGRGFARIRNCLYWDLVHEIVKLTVDTDPRCPSIKNVVRELEKPGVYAGLKKISARPIMAVGDPLPEDVQRYMWEQDKRELEAKFDAQFERIMEGTQTLTSSPATQAYKTVRDKLIAHNELVYRGSSYTSVSIKDMGLKYGDERQVLIDATAIISDLYSVINRTSFDWDRSLGMFESDARALWDLSPSGETE